MQDVNGGTDNKDVYGIFVYFQFFCKLKQL